MTADDGGAIVLLAGSRWENTRGTDHRLAEAMTAHVPVLWVDPPMPFPGPRAAQRPPIPPGYALDCLRPGLVRLRFAAPPGFTRPALRRAASYLLGRAVRAAVDDLGVEPIATLLLSPRDEFPAGLTGVRVLHITDDWPAGAAMMGLSRRRVEAILARNIARAGIVTAVSPYLASAAEAHGARIVTVLPNGCSPVTGDGDVVRPRLAAGIIGQLNERLDFDLLDELAASGIDIEVIGPNKVRDPDARRRLERFLAEPRVTWVGEVTEQDLWPRLRRLSVGLTPYADNEFNRSSFPVKTLDYLAAGLPVVSTDLPATRWLDTELVRTAGTRTEFVAAVHAALAVGGAARDRQARQSFAARHTWDARARQLLTLIAEARA
ncbi:glycosyltransferase [Specibacter cremeus]|uniref:glycosyltransferase n=1 Tax=Specibacter cremeus TaxID=1629051 RepID=UPI000F7A1763|nr:glycosyltransferase [Specibacter cremeus]